MTTSQQIAALHALYSAALDAAEATVPWPLQITRQQYAQAAACEAVVETGWLQHLPSNSNNCLGIKAYRGWTGPTVTANGTEQLPNGAWTGPQSDLWCVFDSYKSCFTEQLQILQEPRYKAAATSPTVQSYIVTECATWSTGQQKGAAVLATFNAHKGELQ